MMKRIIISLFLITIFLFMGVNIVISNMIDDVQQISISDIDLSDRVNGKYIGEYSITPVHVKVEVSVSNHQITNIAILQHNNGLGSVAESIVNDVVEEQSLDIDVVSGATVSSKCILKAIENAVEN